MENTENFVVYIHQPVNAVLGKHRKLRIRLINAEDGRLNVSVGDNVMVVFNICT